MIRFSSMPECVDFNHCGNTRGHGWMKIPWKLETTTVLHFTHDRPGSMWSLTDPWPKPITQPFLFLFWPLNIQLYLGTHSVKSTSWVMNIPVNKVQGKAVTSSDSLELTMELVFPTGSANECILNRGVCVRFVSVPLPYVLVNTLDDIISLAAKNLAAVIYWNSHTVLCNKHSWF